MNNKIVIGKNIEFLDVVEIVLALNSFGKYYSTIYLSKEFCKRFNRRYEDNFSSYFHVVRFSTESLLYLLQFMKVTSTAELINSTLSSYLVPQKETENCFGFKVKDDYMQNCFKRAKVLCEIEEETHFRDGLDWVLK